MKTTALAESIVFMLKKIVSILNNTIIEIETTIGEGEEDEGEETRSDKEKDKGSKGKDAKDTSKDDDDDGDAPSEDDIVKAVRAALKILEKKEVSKIIKKYGKADRAVEVDEELRQKVIDELEKAVARAEEVE